MKKYFQLYPYSLYVGVLLVVLYNINYVILWDDSYITILDCLDDLLPTFKMVADTHTAFNPDAIMPVGEGFRRSLFSSLFDPIGWLFVFFSPYCAIVIQIFICKIAAFVGMYLLLRELFKGIENTWIPLACSFLFSIIPFYYIHGLGTAGTPIVTYAFFNLYKEKRICISLSILFLFGIYSYFPLIGLFTCAAAAISIVMITMKQKHLPKIMIFGLCLLSITYIVANWSLFATFCGGEKLQRVEFKSDFNLLVSIKQLISCLLISQSHAGNFFSCLGIVPLLVCTLFDRKDIVLRYLSLSVLLISTIIIVSNIAKSFILLFSSFQFDRFYFFIPLLSIVSLSYLLFKYQTRQFFFLFIPLLPLMALSSLRYDGEHTFLIRKYIIKKEVDYQVSFRKFYDVPLFSKIKSELGINNNTDGVKSCAVGFHPNILMFNGIPSVDFYHNVYPLDYKHRFRFVIEKELIKDTDLLNYFDNWGNRCYVFSSELGKSYLYGKKSGRSIKNLEINTTVLQDLGCSYILSAVPIDNYKDINLTFVNSYTTPQSYWKIWVYKIGNLFQCI